MARTRATRTFAGVKFAAVRPGQWISACGRYGIYHMLAGLSASEWQVFHADSGEPIYGDTIGIGLSMAEAACDAFGLQFRAVYRRCGIASSSKLKRARR